MRQISVVVRHSDCVETNAGGVETNVGGVETNLGGVETNVGGVQTNLGGVQQGQTMSHHTWTTLVDFQKGGQFAWRCLSKSLW